MNPVETDATQIASRIRDYIRQRFKVPEKDPDFTDDVHLFEYGYVDSFGAVELTHFVETEFSIQVTESDMIVHPLNTIDQIAQFVADRRSGQV